MHGRASPLSEAHACEALRGMKTDSCATLAFGVFHELAALSEVSFRRFREAFQLSDRRAACRAEIELAILLR